MAAYKHRMRLRVISTLNENTITGCQNIFVFDRFLDKKLRIFGGNITLPVIRETVIYCHWGSIRERVALVIQVRILYKKNYGKNRGFIGSPRIWDPFWSPLNYSRYRTLFRAPKISPRASFWRTWNLTFFII